jgi:catechol-2,3-dioxygenase
MTVSGIAEVTLEAADSDTLAAFYNDVIGLPEISRDDDRIWLAAGADARLGTWDFFDRAEGEMHGVRALAD